MSWLDDPVAPEMDDGWAKLLLNMLPLAAETLPRGGVLTVSLDDDATALRMTVSAEGAGPRISEECQLAMAPDASLDDMTPRSIHAYFVTRLASQLETDIEIDNSADDCIVFTVRMTR